MSRNIIEEYLVSVGFDVDNQTVKEAQSAFDKLGMVLEKLAERFKGNKGLQAVNESLNKTLADAATKIGAFLATTEGIVLSATAGIIASITLVGTTLAAVMGQFMNRMAQADMQVQLFARRLFTTVENARSLKAVMDAMGVKSLEELNDVAMNPELRRQFMGLRQLAGGLALNEETKEGLQNIRAVGYEMQRIGLIFDYFFQKVGGYLGQSLAPVLKDIDSTLHSFGDFLAQHGEQWARIIGKMGGAFGRLAELLSQTIMLVTGIDAAFKLLGGKQNVSAFEKLLDVINGILDGLNAIMGFARNPVKASMDITSSIRSGDIFKTGQTAMETLAEYTRKIYDFLAMVWQRVQDPLRFLRDKGVEAGKYVLNQAINASPPVAAALKVWEHMTGGGHGTINPGVKLSGGISAALEELNQRFGGGYTVTSGVAGRSGRSNHPLGRAVDLVPRDQSVAGYMSMVESLLNTPRVKNLNLELRTDKYKAVMAGLKGHGIDTSRIHHQITKDWTGEHVHANLRAQAPVNIHIHGVTDPKQVAAEVRQVLKQRDAEMVRNYQGAFA